MARNIARINNYANTVQARQDWRDLATKATEAGQGELVKAYQPEEGAGWRAIDKAIGKLREAMKETESDGRSN